MPARTKHKETALSDGKYLATRKRESALAARQRLAIEAAIVSALTRAACRTVAADLPNCLPVMREEFAIWRAFLSEEIDAIMRDYE